MEIIDKESVQKMVDNDDYNGMCSIQPMLLFEIAVQLEKLVELQNGK